MMDFKPIEKKTKRPTIIKSPEKSTIKTEFRHFSEEKVKYGGRKNGRDFMKCRPIYLKSGVNQQARGSAYIEMADTKIICTVFGPRESVRREEFSMSGQLTCELKFAPFSCRDTRRQHQQDQQEREMSDVIMKAFQSAVRLDQYPKGVIDICVKVLEDDGNVLGAALTCVSVALSTAGIEMFDLVIGASVRQHGDLMLVDPDYDEEQRLEVTDPSSDGLVTLAMMTSLNQVTAMTMTGEIGCDTALQCVRACTEACYQIYPVVQRLLMDNVAEENTS